MFGLVSSKSYRALQYDLGVIKEQLESAEYALRSWKNAAEAAKSDLQMWRAKFELSQTSPEIKADTEAAFTRGAQFAKQQLLNNILFIAQSISVQEPEKEDSDA
jgi:predicted  nucleic acid-binding Zn-ribbon protein